MACFRLLHDDDDDDDVACSIIQMLTGSVRCIFSLYIVVRWHILGVMVKGVTVCFLMRWRNNLKYVWIILLKNDFFEFPKVKWLQYTAKMGNVKAIDVKFSQELPHQKSLKSVNFWQSYWKNKKGGGRFCGHSVYTSVYVSTNHSGPVAF